MIIKTERPIAVFDLDGVIVANPPESLGGNTITDPEYWHHHWSQPEKAVFHDEILILVKALSASMPIVILTARPDSYWAYTVELLHRAGIFVKESPAETLSWFMSPILVMHPTEGDKIPSRSGNWKRDVIQGWLDQGAKIQFVMEDYKPNAEAIRELVPVLLYERKKPSQYTHVR